MLSAARHARRRRARSARLPEHRASKARPRTISAWWPATSAPTPATSAPRSRRPSERVAVDARAVVARPGGLSPARSGRRADRLLRPVPHGATDRSLASAARCRGLAAGRPGAGLARTHRPPRSSGPAGGGRCNRRRASAWSCRGRWSPTLAGELGLPPSAWSAPSLTSASSWRRGDPPVPARHGVNVLGRLQLRRGAVRWLVRYLGYVVELAACASTTPATASRTPARPSGCARCGRTWPACRSTAATSFARREHNIVGNMDFREAARLASDIGVEVLVPMHWEMFAHEPRLPGRPGRATSPTLSRARRCWSWAAAQRLHRRAVTRELLRLQSGANGIPGDYRRR